MDRRPQGSEISNNNRFRPCSPAITRALNGEIEIQAYLPTSEQLVQMCKNSVMNYTNINVWNSVMNYTNISDDANECDTTQDSIPNTCINKSLTRIHE